MHPMLMRLILRNLSFVNSLQNQEYLNEQDVGSQTPLHLVAVGGHIEVIEVLLKAGANMEEQDMGSQTPLHRAAEGGHVEVVEALLKVGANKEAQNRGSCTPLHQAAERGHV